jgi:hypothetical protein
MSEPTNGNGWVGGMTLSNKVTGSYDGKRSCPDALSDIRTRAFGRSRIVHDLNRAATGIGITINILL